MFLRAWRKPENPQEAAGKQGEHEASHRQNLELWGVGSGFVTELKCNAYLLSPRPSDGSKSIICTGNDVNKFYDLIESSIVEPESLARV